MATARKGKNQTEDILWKMLSEELGMDQVNELRTYLEGDGDHYEMGYGGLTIEPYDARGGSSKMFVVRHEKFGNTTISHSALLSVLHDLRHALLKRQSASRGSN